MMHVTPGFVDAIRNERLRAAQRLQHRKFDRNRQTGSEPAGSHHLHPRPMDHPSRRILARLST